MEYLHLPNGPLIQRTGRPVHYMKKTPNVTLQLYTLIIAQFPVFVNTKKKKISKKFRARVTAQSTLPQSRFP